MAENAVLNQYLTLPFVYKVAATKMSNNIIPDTFTIIHFRSYLLYLAGHILDTLDTKPLKSKQ